MHLNASCHDGVLELRVEDDGRGGAGRRPGSGIRGLRDRVEALGGTLDIESPLGAGTRLVARIPLEPAMSPQSRVDDEVARSSSNPRWRTCSSISERRSARG